MLQLWLKISPELKWHYVVLDKKLHFWILIFTIFMIQTQAFIYLFLNPLLNNQVVLRGKQDLENSLKLERYYIHVLHSLFPQFFKA